MGRGSGRWGRDPLSRLWLAGIGAAFVALLGVGLGLALTLDRTRGLLPSDRPEGVVQRFLMAVDDGRFEEAYGHLTAQSRADCALQEFVHVASLHRGYGETTVSLDRVDVTDSQATVWVRHEENAPFGVYGFREAYRLVLEEGQWHIEANPSFSPAKSWCPPRPLAPAPVPVPQR